MSTLTQDQINKMSDTLLKNPSKITTDNLIQYIRTVTQNKDIPSSENAVKEYVKIINNTYDYENINFNKANYPFVSLCLIMMLIPFYYNFPRLYTTGYLSSSIALFGLFGLTTKLSELYGRMNSNIVAIYLVCTIVFYFVFFVLFNKLNHISLFFMSGVIMYVMISSIARLKVCSPLENNVLSEYQSFVEINELSVPLTEHTYAATQEFKKRFNIQSTSINTLYSSLCNVKYIKREHNYLDFFLVIAGYIVSLVVLYFSGKMFSEIEVPINASEDKTINLIPLLGWKKETFPYLFCQANYVLPKELSYHQLAHELLDNEDMDEEVYKKVYKTLQRVSNELITKFHPTFTNMENVSYGLIVHTIGDNEVLKKIQEILKRDLSSLDTDYIKEIHQRIMEADIPFKDKKEMYDLLSHLNNVLEVHALDEKQATYENDVDLAKEVFQMDDELGKSVKGGFKKLIETYIENFEKHIHPKNNVLIGYHYNLITFTYFPKKWREFMNKVFAFLLSFISVWLFLAKPLGTPWVLARYIMSSNYGANELLEKYKKDEPLWKFMNMGVDYSFVEKQTIPKSDKQTSLMDIIWKWIKTILLFSLGMIPLMNFFSSVVFGMSIAPTYMNFIYALMLLGNIIGNMIITEKKGEYFTFNVVYFIVFFLVLLGISIVMIFLKK